MRVVAPHVPARCRIAPAAASPCGDAHCCLTGATTRLPCCLVADRLCRDGRDADRVRAALPSGQRHPHGPHHGIRKRVLHRRGGQRRPGACSERVWPGWIIAAMCCFFLPGCCISVTRCGCAGWSRLQVTGSGQAIFRTGPPPPPVLQCPPPINPSGPPSSRATVGTVRVAFAPAAAASSASAAPVLAQCQLVPSVEDGSVQQQ